MESGFDFTIANNQWGGEGGSQTTQTENVERSMLPVLFKDFVETPPVDDKIKVGNYAFQTLIICGQLVGFDETNTELTYKIRDPEECGDTTIDGSIFQRQTFNVENFAEGQWVKVVSKLKAFGGQFSLLTYNMLALEGPKELRLHKVEAQLAKYYFLDNGPEKLMGPTVPEYVGTALSNDTIRKPLKPEFQDPNFNAFANQSAAINNLQGNRQVGGVKSEADNRGLTGNRRLIYEYIEANPGDTGSHVEEIRRHLGNPLTFDQDLQYLANEGIVFNTVDESHFSVL